MLPAYLEETNRYVADIRNMIKQYETTPTAEHFYYLHQCGSTTTTIFISMVCSALIKADKLFWSTPNYKRAKSKVEDKQKILETSNS